MRAALLAGAVPLGGPRGVLHLLLRHGDLLLVFGRTLASQEKASCKSGGGTWVTSAPLVTPVSSPGWAP
jgi:hypothetical protein